MKSKHTALAVGAIVLAIAGSAMLLHRYRAAPEERVDFNRDIRPIFNSNCMACHGGVKQASNVSFSYREQVLGKGKSGRPTVVPGNPQASELMARVTSKDTEVRMPLNGAPLSARQIALLRAWIKQGAPWSDYWAFVPPKPQPLPAVKDAGWARQPLDRFVLARLERESLAPSPEAGKLELLRRVSLDLTGMPPTPEEQAAFLADTSKNAYEKQVDRLLASPRYGERWASMWLDVARYGDSKGFEKDRSRTVWPYRDWVIDAFNSNMPYDQFVIRQLAGDLLPNAKFSDLIATSFHRQTQANDEGGTDDEEFRIAAVMDRTATTWSALNGVSFNCVQCHSHPYDPFRHVEYYKFMAFFNTQRDADIAFDNAREDDWPVLRVPTDKTLYAEADHLQKQIHDARDSVVAASRAAEADQRQWKQLPVQQASVSEILAIKSLLTQLQAKPADKKKADQIAQLQKDLARAATHPPEAGFRIRQGMAETTGTVPLKSVIEFIAPFNQAALTALRIEVPPADAVAEVHSPEKGFIINHVDAWVVRADGGTDKIAFRFLAPDAVDSLVGDIARDLRNNKDNGPARSQASVMESLAANSGVLADPNLFTARWVVAVPEMPLNLPAGAKLKIQLTQTESVNQTTGAAPRVRLFASSDPRWPVLAHSPQIEKAIMDLEQSNRDLAAIPSVPVPVMAEQANYEKRATLEYDRGSFLTQMGPSLTPDTPALFPRFPVGAPRNRLTLAKWFFAPGQPLTARVAVNRYWEHLFGTGIVESLEDFGSAGEMPSHPELLDWLALHFQNDLHWNQKALVREIVTSATYRQSARTTEALHDKDPRNRLLAHGPQQRLSAEMVRDQAMLASGLLNPQMGGPPVMPVQPENIWNLVSNNPERWANAKGSDRYRRAVYTFVKRTALYPSFVIFDAADRSMTSPRRITTNTPLQALVTLNDPVYHEAAFGLAGRMLKDGNGGSTSLDDRLNYGASLVLSRQLEPAELVPLRRLYREAAGGSGPTSLAGYTAVSTALFNLDAALIR